MPVAKRFGYDPTERLFGTQRAITISIRIKLVDQNVVRFSQSQVSTWLVVFTF
jgi:hypothetical protein